MGFQSVDMGELNLFKFEIRKDHSVNMVAVKRLTKSSLKHGKITYLTRGSKSSSRTITSKRAISRVRSTGVSITRIWYAGIRLNDIINTKLSTSNQKGTCIFRRFTIKSSLLYG